MSKRKSRHFFNFDEDTSDLYSDIDTKTLVDDVKSKEHLSTTEFFLSNRLESKVNSLRYENINVDVSDKDVRKFFDGKIAKKMNSSRSNMIEEIKNTFINSILVYTGLTAVDLKNIGNVQTSHNMNKNNYVSEDLKYDRNDYDDPYKRKKFKNSRRHDDGSCVDAYTGKRTYSPETDHKSNIIMKIF